MWSTKRTPGSFMAICTKESKAGKSQSKGLRKKSRRWPPPRLKVRKTLRMNKNHSEKNIFELSKETQNTCCIEGTFMCSWHQWPNKLWSLEKK
jgi:hypothetical protein